MPQPYAIIQDCGEMAERSKAHAWKACIRPKRIEGSNPSLSAKCLYKSTTYGTFPGCISTGIPKTRVPRSASAPVPRHPTARPLSDATRTTQNGHRATITNSRQSDPHPGVPPHFKTGSIRLPLHWVLDLGWGVFEMIVLKRQVGVGEKSGLWCRSYWQKLPCAK